MRNIFFPHYLSGEPNNVLRKQNKVISLLISQLILVNKIAKLHRHNEMLFRLIAYKYITK